MILELSLRPCISGEALLSSGECTMCSEGFYLLIPPIEPTSCIACPGPSIATCMGGNLLFPQNNYWRSSLESDVLYQCRNEEACM